MSHLSKLKLWALRRISAESKETMNPKKHGFI